MLINLYFGQIPMKFEFQWLIFKKYSRIKISVKITITYAVKTWCLKARMAAKLNSTEMNFWLRSALISRKYKTRNTVIKQK
jgi:hypothetical protein